MEFKDALRNARKAKGMTQVEIAEAMNITKSTYCGYETGKRQPDVAKIKQISEILEIPADQLLQTGHGEDSAFNLKYQKLIPYIDQMTDAEVEKAMSYFQGILDARK